MLNKLCCLSTDCCKCSLLGSSRNQNIKLTYILLILLTFLYTLILNSYSSTQQQIQSFDCQQLDIKYQQECVHNQRFTINFFALSVVHALILLCMIPKNKYVKVINEGLWILKTTILVVLLILLNLTKLGSQISEVLQLAAIWLSPILYLFITFVLVDFAYSLDFSINTFSQKNRKFYIVKVIITVLLWAVGIVSNIFSYFYNQLWISIVTSVVFGVFLVLTFLRISKNNSLLIYSILMLHLSLTSYSIHEENSSDSVQQHEFSSIQHIYRKVYCILLLVLMLFQGGNKIRTKNSTINQILALNTTLKQEDNRYVSSNKWLVYHLVMIFVTFLLPTIFAYEKHQIPHDNGLYLNIGRITWWVSLILVYKWSIIVQKIYPQQDLGELQNYFKQFQLN